MNYRIDLLPPELSQRRALGLRRFVLLFLAIVILAGSGAGYRFFLARCAQVAGELAALNENLPPLRKQAARLEEIKAQRRDLEKRSGELAALHGNRRPWPEILAAVAWVVPGEVWLTGLRAEAAQKKEEGEREEQGKAVQQAPGKAPQPGPGPVESAETARKTFLPGKALPPASIPGVPDTLVIEGASYSAPAVGIFISQLDGLPYFSQVTLTGLHFEEGEGCLVFTAAASLKAGAPSEEQVK